MSINKISLITFFILAFAINSFAQFQTSIWGGVNNSSFGGNPPENASYGSIYGLCVGADIDFQPTEDFVISLEPSFEQKGSNINFNIEKGLEDTTLSLTVKQNYFGLGILFKVNAGNFFVGSGVSAQLLNTADLESSTEKKDIKDKFKSYDAVAFFNLGYKIPIGGPAIFFELRYLQGLISIRSEENQSDTEIYLSNFKSTGLRLSTGIIIPL